jgi:hypothetical protein
MRKAVGFSALFT